MKRLLYVAAVLAALAGGARADERPAHKLTFREAIDAALARHPRVAVAGEKRAVAELAVDRVRAERLPSAHVDGVVQRWDGQFNIVFGPMSILARDSVTSNVRVSVNQPLSRLAYLSDLVGAREHDVAVAGANYDKARLDVAYRVAEAYLAALRAQAASTVAHQSVTTLTAELERARNLRAADTLNDIDVLRLQSAKAAADQFAVRADTAVQEAAARLGLAVGLTGGEEVEVVDDLPTDPPDLAMPAADAEQRALAARPELRASRERLAAVDDDRAAARMEYVPTVGAVAAYEHITGFGDFQPANSFYAGLTLSWNVWDWGARSDAVRTIEHEHTSIELEDRLMGDDIRVEARMRWRNAKASHDNLGAAATQLKAAEEAARLQKVRFDAGAATVTDVLAAETEAVRARMSAADARYDYYLALVTLARAVGDLPQAGAK
jgi:outer membrane protein